MNSPSDPSDRMNANQFDDEGLPYSISFTARLDGESELVELGRAWQAATGYHLERPKL